MSGYLLSIELCRADAAGGTVGEIILLEQAWCTDAIGVLTEYAEHTAGERVRAERCTSLRGSTAASTTRGSRTWVAGRGSARPPRRVSCYVKRPGRRHG